MMRRYDATARLYDMRYVEEQEAKYEVALARLKVEGAVLDVGCGSGLLFSHVAAQAETVVGVDVSGKLLVQAKERAKNFRNVHLVQADADNLPFGCSFFNVIFAFTVLQNMPKPVKTLVEVKRTGKRAGFIVVTGLKKAFSLETFQSVLQKAGLHVIFLEDDQALKCYLAVNVPNS